MIKQMRDINIQDQNGDTVLQRVMNKGYDIGPTRKRVIAIILGTDDVDVDVQNNLGQTALHTAALARLQYMDLWTDLLNLSEDREAIDNAGRTAASYARELNLRGITNEFGDENLGFTERPTNRNGPDIAYFIENFSSMPLEERRKFENPTAKQCPKCGFGPRKE